MSLKAFKMKRLFRSQLLKGEVTRFPTCAQHIPQCQHLKLGKKVAHQIEILMQKYDRRLTSSQEENLQFKLVEDPFSMNPEEELIKLQLEVIEPQASSVSMTKHRESSLLDCYRSLNRDKYKNLVQSAKKTLSIFGVIYICEQAFSIMNINKNKHLFCPMKVWRTS